MYIVVRNNCLCDVHPHSINSHGYEIKSFDNQIIYICQSHDSSYKSSLHISYGCYIVAFELIARTAVLTIVFPFIYTRRSIIAAHKKLSLQMMINAIALRYTTDHIHTVILYTTEVIHFDKQLLELRPDKTYFSTNATCHDTIDT